MDVHWPEPRAKVDVSGLKAYSFSSKYDLLFCPTCSTPLFFAQTQDQDQALGLFTGTLKNDPGDIIKITSHIFVGDTQDGGASMWLRHPNADGSEAKRYTERDVNNKGEKAEAIPRDWPSAETMSGFDAKHGGPVPMWCKCKGVNLLWQPRSYDGKKDTELPWFVDPRTHKPLAGFCACDSCRLFVGVDIFNWGFAELEDISFANGQSGFPDSSVDLRALVDAKDPSLGTLTYYASSPDAQRYFCSNCSASIFYAWDERAFMVDIAPGLIEAPDGARAEGTFSWALGGTFSHLGDNIGGWREGLFDRVAKESEEWRIEREYPKHWRRLAREEATKEE